MFPDYESYLDVYDKAGLIHNKVCAKSPRKETLSLTHFLSLLLPYTQFRSFTIIIVTFKVPTFFYLKQTVLGHGIYLSDKERKKIKEKGASISHCPNSNLS